MPLEELEKRPIEDKEKYSNRRKIDFREVLKRLL